MAGEVVLEQVEHFHGPSGGIVKLIPPFFGKPRIASLLLAMLSRVNELETAAWDVLTRYTIEGADTARLDVLGAVVGQPRFWASDDTYRAVIRAKIRTNNSSGRDADLVEVVQLALDNTDHVYIRTYYPATAFVWLETDVDADRMAALQFLLPKARSAGVQMHVFTVDGGLPDGAIWDESTWDSGDEYWAEEIL